MREMNEGSDRNDRSVKKPGVENVSQLSEKQYVSKEREIENKQEYDRSEKTLSISELNERGSFVKNEIGDFKRKRISHVAGRLNGRDSFAKNEPDINMPNNNAALEQSWPIFLAIRVILLLFTATIEIGAGVSSKVLSAGRT